MNIITIWKRLMLNINLTSDAVNRPRCLSGRGICSKVQPPDAGTPAGRLRQTPGPETEDEV